MRKNINFLLKLYKNNINPDEMVPRGPPYSRMVAGHCRRDILLERLAQRTQQSELNEKLEKKHNHHTNTTKTFV